MHCSVDTLLRMVEHADVQSTDVFVDAGSGHGRAAVLTRLVTGASVIGLEIQPGLVRSSRGLATSLNVPRFSVVEGDAAMLTGFITIGSVFFLYCPFSGGRLESVLDDLESIARTRQIRICCIALSLPSVGAPRVVRVVVPVAGGSCSARLRSHRSPMNVKGMRILAWWIVFLGTAAAARNHVGPWGENPDLVPPFAPKEERRAPKNPEGEALWQAFQTPRNRERVTGALLVCHLQVGQPKDPWRRAALDVVTLGAAELANADVTLRLRLRAEPPIVLWGPAKHDASFVSVPAVTLSRGDRLGMALVDRGLWSDTPLGHVSTRWDGGSPFTLSTPKWTARCTLLEPDEVSAHARPWVESLDRQLDRIDAARIDRTLPDLGRPVRELRQLRNHFRDSLTGEGNFRYAAGYLGWEHPEIQVRLERLRRSEAAFDEAAAREVKAIRQELATPGPLMLGASTLRLSRSPRAGTLSLRVEAGTDFDCGSFQSALGTVALVDELGHYYPVTARLRDAAGRRCEPDTTDAKPTPPLSGTLEATESRRLPLRLLRLADGSFARID